MEVHRILTEDEIRILEDNGCIAQDWTSVYVSEDFSPLYIRNVNFYGDVFLGLFEKNIELSNGFLKHSGIRNATLNNVSIGDNCLIENIPNFISNYTIGEECCIINVCVMQTTDGATYGEGNMIPVLNEAGSGNVLLYCGLTSNIAALMVAHYNDREFVYALKKMIREDIDRRIPERSTIGDNVKIVNVMEMTNTNVSDNCEINGSCRLSDCTLYSGLEDSVYIGSGVICENTIIADGSAVLNGAKLYNCYVGESSQITNGFTAENSLFFANTFMGNGEACASLCGPFSISHHKSTLLIGGMYSFYNAGSATNYSNHAYKMGPIHYGILERGSKTASGSHVLFPATIGSFSVCLGKITTNPDTSSLPFSYVIGDGRNTYIVPCRNIISVGLYRDVSKWQRRDVRLLCSKKSLINYNWLNPFTINEIKQGKEILENLRDKISENKGFYNYKGCKISSNSLLRGISLYSMAIDMFIGKVLKTHKADELCGTTGAGIWHDLLGLLLPLVVEENIVSGVKNGFTDSVAFLIRRLKEGSDNYSNYLWAYTCDLIKTIYGIERLSESDIDNLVEKGEIAHKEWLNEIRKDAEKEYEMGDVEKGVLDNFISQLESDR
ncbi:MAG: DUF4954 family protein [Prevotella sp.]|nr:DUF4954 family protein [Prevotella sp.]